jgi:hypothetical protein
MSRGDRKKGMMRHLEPRKFPVELQTALSHVTSKYDRRSLGQYVLVSSTHLGPATVSWYGAPSLRIPVCRLQLLLGTASADFLGAESPGSHDHILPQF